MMFEYRDSASTIQKNMLRLVVKKYGSKVKVAELLQISRQQLLRYESGKHIMRLDTYLRLKVLRDL